MKTAKKQPEKIILKETDNLQEKMRIRIPSGEAMHERV